MLFFPLMCLNIYTNEVVTIAEAAETVEMLQKLQAMKHSMSGFQAKKGRFESGFFNYQAWQIWETMPANSFGDQGNSVKVFWIKGIKGTIGFIKGGAHLRHFWRIWFHSIVGCPWRGREKYNGSWGKQMNTKRFSFVLWKRRFLTMFCHAGPSSLVSKAWSNL